MLIINFRGSEIKSYKELKAKMETSQQQIGEAKKNERAYSSKEVRRFSKSFGFTSGMLKVSLKTKEK